MLSARNKCLDDMHATVMVTFMKYHIMQNGGGEKLWQIGSFKNLVVENFGKLK